MTETERKRLIDGELEREEQTKTKPSKAQAQAGGAGGAGAGGGLKDQGENPPPGQPKEMGQESLTCCAGPLGPDAWVLL